MLVCSSQKSAQALEELLAGFLQAEVVRASQLQQAQELLAQDVFRLVIVNLPFHDENMESFIAGAAQSTSSGILLLCPQETADQMLKRCLPHGILVVPKPISRPLFVQSVYLGLSTSARLAGLLQENRMLHSKLEELKLVSRAKAVLIEYLKLTEPQAHRYVEKQAMDLGLTRLQVAQNILKTYES
ncbi:MAG: ANTAR domain-containing protein [Oscillospiraceae bacterium]|nr:ANTAR domain-containing protein [Oscillospiraceae bacterium]